MRNCFLEFRVFPNIDRLSQDDDTIDYWETMLFLGVVIRSFIPGTACNEGLDNLVIAEDLPLCFFFIPAINEISEIRDSVGRWKSLNEAFFLFASGGKRKAHHFAHSQTNKQTNKQDKRRRTSQRPKTKRSAFHLGRNDNKINQTTTKKTKTKPDGRHVRLIA